MNTAPAPAVDRRRAMTAALASFSGAVVEWYDFLIFGLTAATVFNTQFFAFESPVMNLLASFATLGIGFLFRPLGGWWFGRMGDRIGQKRVLLRTMTIMGVATVLMGFLPTYHQAGMIAPILLTVLRSLQGFAVGGEWGGAALLAVKHAPANRRALYSSGVQLGYAVGLVLASAAVSLMTRIAGDDFLVWGWRVPFFAALILFAVGLVIRSQVVEDAPAPRATDDHPSLRAAILENPVAFAQIIGLRLVELFTMYIVTTFAVGYGTEFLGLPRAFMVDIALIVGAGGLISIPLFAYLSDRVGRRTVYTIGAIIGALGAFPFFWAMESGSFVLVIIAAVVLINIAHDMAVSVQQPLFAEMFGERNQNTGAGFGYQVASAIAGGFTPFIATSLVAGADDAWWPVALYLLIGCVITAVVAQSIRRPAHLQPAAKTPVAVQD